MGGQLCPPSKSRKQTKVVSKLKSKERDVQRVTEASGFLGVRSLGCHSTITDLEARSPFPAMSDVDVACSVTGTQLANTSFLCPLHPDLST